MGCSSLSNSSLPGPPNNFDVDILDISYNPEFVNITAELFQHFTSLKLVLMHGLTDINLFDAVFENQNSLKIIDFTGSTISSVGADVFSGLPSLEAIFGLRLDEVPENLFDSLGNLKQLTMTVQSDSIPDNLFRVSNAESLFTCFFLPL